MYRFFLSITVIILLSFPTRTDAGCGNALTSCNYVRCVYFPASARCRVVGNVPSVACGVGVAYTENAFTSCRRGCDTEAGRRGAGSDHPRCSRRSNALAPRRRRDTAQKSIRSGWSGHSLARRTVIAPGPPAPSPRHGRTRERQQTGEGGEE